VRRYHRRALRLVLSARRQRREAREAHKVAPVMLHNRLWQDWLLPDSMSF